MDSFSPSALARVRVLVVPVGRIKRSRFYSFYNLLAPLSEVKLEDVTPDPRPDRSFFSPQAFPDGFVLYDFMMSMPSVSELSLAPFELFREPLMIVGIADGQEHHDASSIQAFVTSALEAMDEQYPRMLVRKVVMFDLSPPTEAATSHSELIVVPPSDKVKATTMKTILCDITSSLLAEMTTLFASIKALPSIAPPSVISSGAGNAGRASSASPSVSRTNSQIGERSISPTTNHQHRMSMPVFSSTPDYNSPRLETPESGRQTPPARTFEELVGSISPPGGSNKATPINSRDASRDRVSMSGFGPGSLDERKRNQGKCRVAIVISSLHMLAGHWQTALNDLAEAAGQARSFSDHIWHAKALENMLTCLVLLAWAGVPFKIPSVCYPIMDRTSSKLAAITSPVSPTPNGASATEIANARKELAIAIPEMANMIISTYNRAANYTGEYLPQLAYSECIIRLSKIQAGIVIGGNTMNDAAGTYIVRNVVLQDLRSQFLSAGKARITDMLMKAMPGSPEASGLSAADEASVLAGVASTLSVLGLQRKKALMLNEYVHVLIRALDDAKRSGAAEAGIHPSTNGFAHSNLSTVGTSGASEGLEDFLSLLCQIYGIPEARWLQAGNSKASAADCTDGESRQDTILPEQLVGDFIVRSFGSLNVKSDVLRTCISLCQALPDPQGVLHWASALLRISGPGTAPTTDSTDALVTISREEQLILSSTISKTTSDAKAMGLQNIKADYWDEFLVRGVTLIASSDAHALHLHKRSDLLATESKQVAKKGPFIHNPFLEKATTKSAQNLIVVGDEREFVVSLQNPYDFDIYIESIGFLAGDHEFGLATNLILRPYRTQSFSVTGKIDVAGTYELDRCVIKIQGCRKRAFPIFAESWRIPYDPKIRSIGLPKPRPKDERPESDASISLSRTVFPRSTVIPLTVIPAQAVLLVGSTSLPQSSLMLLEGESARFTMRVRNISDSAAADFLHISFNDSTAAAIQDALAKKNLNSVELFELEFQTRHHPAVRLVGTKPGSIAPNDSCDLEFEILGKPGLVNVTVLIDYANMEKSHTENQSTFYTRQIAFPVSVTVNASIQLHRLDILPVVRDTSLALSLTNEQKQGYCLLVFDLRNAWPKPLEINVKMQNQEIYSSDNVPFLRSREVVQPGHLSRMVLLLPKIHIKNPHARVRTANERQFVVSTNALSADTERIARELFWYREALLDRLSATWQESGSSKQGMIDLRNAVRMTPRMVDALKLDDVDIQLTISGHEISMSNKGFSITVGDFAILEAKISNRSESTIYPLLRLRPSLSHQGADAALDLGKRLAWSGLLQRTMQPVEPGKTVVAKLALCALCSGEYEVGATVEEIKRARSASRNETGIEENGIPDLVAMAGMRRSWIAVTPCRLIASDRETPG